MARAKEPNCRSKCPQEPSRAEEPSSVVRLEVKKVQGLTSGFRVLGFGCQRFGGDQISGSLLGVGISGSPLLENRHSSPRPPDHLDHLWKMMPSGPIIYDLLIFGVFDQGPLIQLPPAVGTETDLRGGFRSASRRNASDVG